MIEASTGSNRIYRNGERPSVDYQNTTVVDVTYVCNATCRYCQWGNSSNPKRGHRPIGELLLPKETLDALGTRRIVLSGGEPRTNPDLGSIIRYYSGLVDDVVIITNGYTLNQEAVAELTEVGATGITISIDSMSPEESVLTRQTPKRLHAQILENVRRISGMPRKFELGINSVVSHPTAKWSTVKGLLEFGLDIGADFVKFQPVFDDGYVTLTSPDLLLTREDAEGLVQISGLLETIPHPMTNPPGFWKDVASLAKGKSLESAWCGLGNRHSIVTTGELKVCYWVKESSFGRSIGALRAEQALTLRKEFESIKLKCEVGYQCFCTQNLTHMWVPRDG